MKLFNASAPEHFTRGQFALLEFYWMIKYYEDKYKDSDDADVIIPI